MNFNVAEIFRELDKLQENFNFKGYIYKITNKLNGKFYIGKTKYAVKTRIYHHLYTCNHRNDVNSAIHNAIRKYGIENFDIEVIDEASSLEELNEKEIYWIDKLQSRNPSIGYNLAKGGEGGVGGPHFAGHRHSDETRAKMSADRKGEKNSNYGNRWTQSDELKELHRQLSSGSNNGMFGKHQSEEAKEKSRLAHKGKEAYSNTRLDKVIMLTPEEGKKLMDENPEWVRRNIHTHR